MMLSGVRWVRLCIESLALVSSQSTSSSNPKDFGYVSAVFFARKEEHYAHHHG
jgi:hypothetical protein